jgi:hypothetical protein
MLGNSTELRLKGYDFIDRVIQPEEVLAVENERSVAWQH